MRFYRRDFLKAAGLATVGGVMPGFISCQGSSADKQEKGSVNNRLAAPGTHSWEAVRANFELDPAYIHMAGLLIASHPYPVREAIREHRVSLNENPADYVQDRFSPEPSRFREVAAAYMNVQPHEIAITNSTTMGTALFINGLQIREDQEMLTADYDYYSTHEAIKYKASSSGASFRKIPIYNNIHQVSEDEIVEKLIKQIRPNTRLVTGTWVHSATGLKIPVKEIANRIAEINKNRDSGDRVIFFLDGVHGFGVESEAVGDLGCDFFSAGTHKWMYGPRGTGILWGNRSVHHVVSPTIPSFTRGAGWGGLMTPGGFKPFEHEWAMTEAFQFHQNIGKDRVQEHIHSLARQLKEGLSQMDHVTLYTPIEENLSAGIVCFDVHGMVPTTVVNQLAERKIIASDTPYIPSYARFTPCIYNTSEEIDQVLRAVRDLA